MQPAGNAPVSFGKYLLDSELARGGMSRVWQARLRGPGGFEKQLVVKQILPQLAQDPSFVELLVHEANTLVRMSHPNIVPVYELGIVDGVYFLAMERVRGATVAELLRAGPLPPALLAELGAQVAEALRYAHERFELVHRDVTPRNVMVDADGHVRLLDFGIAAPSARTGKGELFGSPGYMSPEQAARKALTPASDLYSLGALLFEALTGRRAVVDGVALRLADEPASAADPELAALIDALLATEPEARGSAARVVSRLRGWLVHKQPEGAREQLGKRVDAVLAKAAARERIDAGSAQTDDTGAEASRTPSTSEGSGGAGTQHVTRSIAASATLTEMLAASTTEALPQAAPDAGGAAAPTAGLVAGVAAAPPSRARGFSFVLAAGVAVFITATVVLTQRGSDPERPRAVPAAAKAASAQPPALPTPTAAEAGAAAPPAAAPDMKAPAVAPALPTRGPSTPQPAAEPAATLTIHATPWADARLDAKALGPTPLRALRVRAGAHVLTLDCPPLGKKARVPLHLRGGEQTQVVVDMQTEPPTVSVR